jgi:hypothetical protein
MKHTPGPWKVERGTEPSDFIVMEPTGHTICEPNEPLYADHEQLDSRLRHITFDEALANAHLIAAAPELLEALTAMLDAYDIGQRASNDSAIGKARRAIRKATGRES